MTRQDPHSRITNRILVELEQGTFPWLKPWRGGDIAASARPRPLRASGEPYRGINVLLLWIEAQASGFVLPSWMTYKQAQALGAQVRKGEHGATIVYYGNSSKTVQDEASGEDREKAFRFLKTYTVFNVAQIDGLPEHFHMLPELAPEVERIAAAEAFFASIPATVNHGGEQAYYMPSADRIQLPPFAAFRDAHGYYTTRGHETVHWTRHKNRLDRSFGCEKWGDPGYAREELVVRRVGANKGVKTCLLDSWENPCVPDLPVPVMSRLKSRNGNGTIACREKAQTAETIVGRAGHRKMRMAKATLPELQSSGFYPRQRRSDGCNAAPCRNRFAHENRLMKGVWQPSAPGPVGTACPPSVGSKGRTERLPASHLLVRVNTGSPKWARQRPTWRQSRHNSQTPGVMPRTAILGWTTTDESRRATGAGILTGRVKGGSACETGQSTGWAC